ncbi:MAG: GNAT family N-acetyltransferase [Acetobacteraceae bacterium]
MAADSSHAEDMYRLRQPATADEWDAYHAIRRRVAFEDGDDEDAEERAPDHYPLLLWCGDRPVGTIRVDALDGGAAAFRLVAIDPREQGRGHGRIMLREAEAFAREIGCRKAVVYATPEAAGFYDSAGYAEDPFDDQYFGGVVQMTKALHYAGFSTEDDD